MSKYAQFDGLNYGLKANRMALAAAVRAIVAGIDGAILKQDEANRESGPYLSAENAAGDHVGIRICRDGLRLLNWCAWGKETPRRGGRVFSSAFNARVATGIWGQLHHKASTYHPESTSYVLERLELGLQMLVDGSGIGFYISAMEADTAYVGAGSPGDKAAWIAKYRETGIAPSVAPELAAYRAAFERAGGWENYEVASKVGLAAYAAAKGGEIAA